MDILYFEKMLEDIKLPLNNIQKDQFIKYYHMLVEKNKVMNLTAITEWNEVVLKHFIDSLALANYVSFDNQKVIDLGTGAGFPGVPLKIAFPQLKVTLADSLNKRIKFLNEVIEELGLTEIEAIHGRAEDIGRNPEYREQFDLCVSRAVANLSTLSEYCMPLVAVKGQFIPYKSGNVDEELVASKGAIFKLGGKVSKVEKFVLPESDIERTFVFIDKNSKTAKTYPRMAGKPSKDPLK